jgi:DNA-binding response OmpR family regulator
MLLEASGHQVDVEPGACRALERAKMQPPEVFLLDIGLPEIDNNALAQRLHAQAEIANAVLIAVTDYGQDDDRVRTLGAGFDRHLVKPVDTAKLAAIRSDVASVRLFKQACSALKVCFRSNCDIHDLNRPRLYLAASVRFDKICSLPSSLSLAD